MKIAIIGSGISGLTSAYLLSPHHDVTVYEKRNRLGGHAHTIFIKEGQNKIAVDNGFMVFNPARYPNFVGLLDELGVSTIETTMSFGVSIPGEISYRGDVPGGLFANRSNLISLRFWKFLIEIMEFRKKAKKTLNEQNESNETLGQFLKKHDFSDDLANWFLYPMLAAIWSMNETDKVEDFPAISTFTFLNNHRLLDNSQPKWRTIAGGSIDYVSRIKKSIEKRGAKILLGYDIRSVRRDNDHIVVESSKETKHFDYVVFATHADTTMQLLSDLSNDEKKALEKFTYTKSKTIVHKDTRVLPANSRLLASWNYSQIVKKSGRPLATFTYCMNILQHIPKDTPVFVTLNPHIKIDKDKIYNIEEYAHPQYNNLSLQGQREIELLQGKRRTLFAGAHLGYGFHEDGVSSAINVAKVLGITPSW